MKSATLKKEINWNTHVGKIWAKIFKQVNIPKKGIVIEIAPGNVNKIGYGFVSYRFKGTLYIVEPNIKSLNSIVRQYKKILKDIKIIPIPYRLEDALAYLPSEVDAIVANHPLDDMILGKSLKNSTFKKFFNDHYNTNHGKKTKLFWDKLEEKPKLLKEIKNKIFKELIKLFKKTHPKIIIISQYESFFFKENNITAPDKHAFNIIKRLKRKYSKNYIKITKLKSFIENPDRWLILKFKKI